MTNCLGIYFDGNVVKYAKLVKNNAGTIDVKEHGIKFIKSTLKETLEKVIVETNSDKDVSIVLSAPKVDYNSFQVFKQISNGDLQSVIRLEFEDLCEKKGLAYADFSYVYMLASTIIGDYRRGLMCVCNKQVIEQHSKIGNTNVTAMYPTELLLPTNVPDDDENYVLINLEDKTTVTTAINGKVAYTSIYDIGMKNIFDKFIDVLGSYQKAYDACKQLNVFSDSSSDSNQVQLEEIVEPILQSILHSITEDVNRYKESITKLYISGTAILFTNIDTLFTEYFSIKCEILKPKFITGDAGGVRNIAETLEVLPAVALAKEYLIPVTTDIEFIKTGIVKENLIDKIFGKKKKDDKKEKVTKEKVENKFDFSKLPKFNKEKVVEYAMYPIIVGFLAVISYYVFSNIYMNQVTKMKNEINTKNSKYEGMINIARTDKSAMDSAANQYKAINDEITKTKQQIETNQIGKFNTYNVAAFTQKLIKVIPKNVQLKTISSDDNKKIKIVAQSDKYPNIGYFVANLRLQPDILTNVVINSINNSSVITIEIGGDLP